MLGMSLLLVEPWLYGSHSTHDECMHTCASSMASSMGMRFPCQYRLVYLFTLAIGISLGYLAAAASPNLDVCNIALPTFVTINLFFAGNLAVLDQIPKYWRWFSE
jgi:hypothetical protein